MCVDDRIVVGGGHHLCKSVMARLEEIDSRNANSSGIISVSENIAAHY